MLRWHRRVIDNAAKLSKARGQSTAEFAVILPLLLVLILVGIDFGRVFLGWVELNNVAREAAVFASENPEAWDTNPDTAAQTEYARLVTADAAGIDCVLPSPIPAPSFGTHEVGQPVTVRITCSFHLITPFLSSDIPFFGRLLPDPIPVSASAAFPIMRGVIAGVPVEPVIVTETTTTSQTTTQTTTTTTTTTGPTPTPMCTVPDLRPFTTGLAQVKWAAAGFTSQVVFDPLNPPSNGTITSQKVNGQGNAVGESKPCTGTSVTVKWSAP